MASLHSLEGGFFFVTGVYQRERNCSFFNQKYFIVRSHHIGNEFVIFNLDITMSVMVTRRL